MSATAAAVLLGASAAALQPAASAVPQKPTVPAKASVTHKVTLVTGDVVTVTTMADGKQIADVDRPDSAVGGVKLQEIKGDIYVIPDEAAGLLAADKLDRRLFDVTDLIEMGYDDAEAGSVPLIASFTAAKTRAAVEPKAPRGSRLTRELAGIHGAALSTDKKQARTFWSSIAPASSAGGGAHTLGEGVSKLWLDGRVKADLKESVPLIGAPEAWAAGYTGKGAKVAVLDTGVDADHPDLKDRIDGTASFVPGEAITDVNGHGTHVAGTIVGSGAASGGEYKGVAPDADLFVGKVLGGTEGYGQDSWVVAGMQWAAESGADVVNMSLGDTYPTDGSDPMSQAVDELSAKYGTLFVIAAGNAGPESISAPGAAASALTVAATDKQDQLASFSSTGPLAYSGGMKPDIAAPGVDITAARSQDMTDGGEGLYRTLSGTSMATPHVVGAAAILAQEHPDWTGAQLKEHLMSTAKGLADGYSPYEVGTGRVDVAAAVRTTVRGTGSLFFGNYTWPHEPSDVAVTKDLTFTNTGTAEVTLNLALTNTDGPFTLGADSVTVPAGGTAAVPVTGDPQNASTGRNVGYVIATDAATGRPVTRTSVALLKEEERYDLNIKLVGRDGKPASGQVVVVQAGDEFPWSLDVQGSATMRMPAGRYTVMAELDVPGEKPDRSGYAVLVDPETVLSASTGSGDVVLDAGKARLLRTEAPQRTEDRQRKVDFNIHFNGLDPWYDVRGAYSPGPAVDDIYVSPTEKMTQGEFTMVTRWRKGEPQLGLSVPGGRVSFEAVVQPGSRVGTASDVLRSVYAGEGAAADYRKADAKGKVVVVERSDAVSPQERAANAAAAGATALIVVNDGVGGLQEYVGESTIPVATVHRDAGKALIATARLGGKLTVKQTEYTPYVYDLTRKYPGQVPDRPLVYKPGQGDLARIDARYYATTDGAAEGYRSDADFTPALGMPERERHPGTRTEWVTPDQVWVESHAQNVDSDMPWVMVSGYNTYDKGTTTGLDWFAPAIRPASAEPFGVFNSRAQNYMIFNTQAWSSSSDASQMAGYLPWGMTPTHLQVFQGDTLIHDNPYGTDMQWVEVPAGNLPYRAVLDAERPGEVFRLSTRTHTEWTFMSDTVDSDTFKPFSVLEMNYSLETDLRGAVKAGPPQRIRLKAVGSDGGTVPGNVTKVTLDVSYDDGATWQKVALARGTDGYWTGSFKSAHSKAGGFLSVRSSAETDRGYSIKQEIIRAYGLR